LSFGNDVVAKEGRYAMSVQAVLSGNFIALESTSYGAGSGFTVTGLGLANQTASGSDVAGTINGLSATGSGQSLRGTSGNVDFLSMLYTGTATGAVGNITLGLGIGASFDGLLDNFANPVTGFIQGSVQSEQTTFDDLTKRIDNITRQMEQQRVTLLGQFNAMQQAISSLQNNSSFLSQISGLASARSA